MHTESGSHLLETQQTLSTQTTRLVLQPVRARCGNPIRERGKRGMLQKYCGVTCRTATYASRRAAASWVRIRHRS